MIFCYKKNTSIPLVRYVCLYLNQKPKLYLCLSVHYEIGYFTKKIAQNASPVCYAKVLR